MPRKKASKKTTAEAPYVYEHWDEPSPHPQPDNDLNSSSSSLCSSLQEFSASLDKQLEDSYSAFIPELCSFNFQFAPHASFLVDLSQLPSLAQTLPKKAGFPSAHNDETSVKEKGKELDLYLVSAAGTMNLADVEVDRMAKQKAVARAIIHAVQEIDGYKYINERRYHLKEEDGSRFTFCCSDSQQNKDRAANVKKKAQPSKDVQDGEGHEEAEEGRKKNKFRLPTYDCKGAITIKFSTKSQVLEVKYRHLMVHRETAWRNHEKKTVSKEEIEARNEARREKRRKAKEEGEEGSGKRETDPVTGKRKRQRRSKKESEIIGAREQDELPPSAINDDRNQPPMARRSTSWNADGRNLNTLAELLKADIDNMNAAAGAAKDANQNGTVPATNGHATGNVVSGDGRKRKATRHKGACLVCRKRKIKCDQTKPNCQKCETGNRTCLWEDKVVISDMRTPRDTPRDTPRVVETIETVPKVAACLNCRNGKVKCDQGRPSCLACRLKKRECIYSEPGQMESTQSAHQDAGISQSHAGPGSGKSPSNSHHGVSAEDNGWASGQDTLSQLTRSFAPGVPRSEEGVSDLKPKKKRRKKSPPLWIALSPSPERDAALDLGSALRAQEFAPARRSLLRPHEEQIVFETEND